jgi:hypothetical protein
MFNRVLAYEREGTVRLKPAVYIPPFVSKTEILKIYFYFSPILTTIQIPRQNGSTKLALIRNVYTTTESLRILF